MSELLALFEARLDKLYDVYNYFGTPERAKEIRRLERATETLKLVVGSKTAQPSESDGFIFKVRHDFGKQDPGQGGGVSS